MPKPFSLQAPEDIAKEYGGNKQRIAQAMQMGVVDPTAGTLAGMFIDRMRSAQMQEGAQQPSVAQQVFAPPAPPAPPMGAPPPGGAPPMGAPPMGAPPMGAPPMGGMPPGGPPMGAPPAPPMGGMPPGAPPMGMADGGLAALPVPESMFDEPMDGEYASGGIVAFAGAGEVDEFAGYSPDLQKNLEEYNRIAPQQTRYSNQIMQFFEQQMDPEAQKKRADEDKYFALAQLGATMASTPGSLLQAFGAGVGKALPGLQESAKARRAETREAIKSLAMQEGYNNEQAAKRADAALQGRGEYAKIAKNIKDRTSQENLTREGYRSAETREAMGNVAALEAARIGAAARDKDGLVPTFGQAVELATQNKNLMKDAVEGMAEAEKKYNSAKTEAQKANAFADFKAARAQYSSSFRNYNETAKLIGQEKIPSISINRFPNLALLAEKEKKPSAGTGVLKNPSAGKPPAGVTQAEWNAMTPKERALFQ